MIIIRCHFGGQPTRRLSRPLHQLREFFILWKIVQIHRIQCEWSRTQDVYCLATRWINGSRLNRIRLLNSFKMNIPSTCKIISSFLVQSINSNRLILKLVSNRFVDYIPAASKIQKSASNGDVDASSGNQIDIGYPLGRTDGNNVYINNHLKFILSYHKSVRDGK